MSSLSDSNAPHDHDIPDEKERAYTHLFTSPRKGHCDIYSDREGQSCARCMGAQAIKLGKVNNIRALEAAAGNPVFMCDTTDPFAASVFFYLFKERKSIGNCEARILWM